MSAIRVNHIALVAENVEDALKFWRDIFGLEVDRTEDNEEEAVEVAFLPVGNSEIELIAPTDPESGVAKYLNKRGAGMHHICIDVDDLDATMAQLKEKGAELLTEGPKVRENGIRYTFVHPKSTGGVLLELYEVPK